MARLRTLKDLLLHGDESGADELDDDDDDDEQNVQCVRAAIQATSVGRGAKPTEAPRGIGPRQESPSLA